jgi:ribonucleoside-diphosphate reductase alpha chain
MTKSQEILSKIVIYNKYAKYDKTLNRRETWEEIVMRNKNMHFNKFKDTLNKEDLEFLDEVIYPKVMDKEFLPSMRSLQFAGKPAEINNTRIYNCSFLPVDDFRAFSEIMFLLLSGSGVGYSVQKNHISKLPPVRKPLKKRRYLIGDSIEGWADAIKVLFKAYLGERNSLPDYDFRDIRPKGQELLTAGGKAPGPEVLKECLFQIKKILDRKKDGEQLKPLEAHDIICHIADAVLSGGIRRAALISLFDLDDDEMLSCKFGAWWETNPQRGRANNSAVVVRHKVKEKDFKQLWEKVEASHSGEPGIYFTNDKEWGTNPCVEIALRPFQFCNLTEINGSTINSQKQLNERAYYASVLGTLQAAYTDFHYLRDIWKRTTERDALVGVGITGIGSAKLENLDLDEAAQHAKKANEIWAEKLNINPASRVTTVKPSGTSSLVLGTSSGIHAWHNDYYIRRMRIGKNEALYNYLAQTQPDFVEDDIFKPNTQAVISIPQKSPEGAILRTENVMDLLERVKRFNLEWVKPGHRKGENTNNVSATISVKEDEWEKVGQWMWENKHNFNGLAVLPYDGGTYKQAPFEDISEEKYYEMEDNLNSIDLTQVVEEEDNTDLNDQLACAGGNCEIF